MAVTHRIKRLEVALRVPDQELARGLQQEISTFCRTELYEELQGAFDTIAPDRYIRIDRLELDLPAFANVDEFRDKLGERIREALRVQLDEAEAAAAAVARTSSRAVVGEASQIPVTFGTPYQAADVFIHILNYGVTPWHAVTVAFDDVVSEVIALLQAQETFRAQVGAVLSTSAQAMRRFILQTPTSGRRRIMSLLAEIDESLITDIERVLDIVVEVVTRGGRPALEMDPPVREIAARSMFRHRTIDQAVLGFMLDEVMTTLIAAAGNDARRIMDDLPLAALEMETVVPLRWRQTVRDRMASFAPPPGDQKDGGITAFGQAQGKGRAALAPESSESPAAPESKTAVDSFPDDQAAPGSQDDEVPGQPVKPGQGPVDRVAPEATTVESLPQSDRPFPARPDDSQVSQDEPPQVEHPRKAETVQPEKSSEGKALAERPQQIDRSDLLSAEHNKITPAPPDGDPIKSAERPDATESQPDPTSGFPWMTPYEMDEFHINNAGLVLVAPFFGMVFRDLGYLDKGRDFVTAAARIRAIHFSQFLVTAEQHPAEGDLMLNKILCGLAIDEPLARFIDLTQPELDAAAEILDSALKHWNALKRTSAPVFQQTFLQHEGILTKERTNWLLRIERISADVLIDTLPWTISIIKHPWMKQPVMVEW